LKFLIIPISSQKLQHPLPTSKYSFPKMHFSTSFLVTLTAAAGASAFWCPGGYHGGCCEAVPASAGSLVNICMSLSLSTKYNFVLSFQNSELTSINEGNNATITPPVSSTTPPTFPDYICIIEGKKERRQIILPIVELCCKVVSLILTTRWGENENENEANE
jgi:hypothetical protein